jgi:hypothetical protein
MSNDVAVVSRYANGYALRQDHAEIGMVEAIERARMGADREAAT